MPACRRAAGGYSSPVAYLLYGARGSGSNIVEAALAELGVDYTLRDLDARNGEHRGDAYAAINPQRKMPALQGEDGEVLTESVAILLTLDERHRDRGLLPPPGSRERAQALRWMLFMATEMYPLVEIIDAPERFVTGDGDRQAVRDRAQALWHERWGIVERNIGGSPWLLPSGFTATDLYIGALSHWDLDAGWRREHLPRVVALAEAARSRPAVGPVWARHFPQR